MTAQLYSQGRGPRGVVSRRRTRVAARLALAISGISLAACSAIPRVDVQQTGSTTSEAGDSVTLSLKLARRPSSAVLVYAVSSDESEGTVSSPVRFDASTWAMAQALVITGVDDGERDGDTSYVVTLYARPAADSASDAMVLGRYTLVNRDDDGATFVALGDLPGGDEASFALGVGASGDVVVGYSRSAAGDEAVRFSEADGLVPLQGDQGRAQAVSPDGSLITGSVAEASTQGGRAAALFSLTSDAEVLRGPSGVPGGPPMFWVVEGNAVLDDGRVFGTCIQYAAYGEPLACRYDAPGEVQTFGLGRLLAADSAHAAGTRQAARQAPYFSQATFDNVALPYPDGVMCSPIDGCLAAARAFSANGTVVGTSSVPADGTPGYPLLEAAFVYATEMGSARLPDLASGEDASGAHAISADGMVIGGFGSDERGRVAVLWRAGVPEALEDALLAAGGELPTGFTLDEVTGLSADGRVVVGNGTNAGGNPEGFRVEFR